MLAASELFQGLEVFSVDKPSIDKLLVGEPEFFADLAGLSFFECVDRLVGRRHRKDAIQQFRALLPGCHLFKSSRHQEVVRSAEQLNLALGNLDDEHGLSVWQMSEVPDNLLHLSGFRLAEYGVGVGDSTENIGEGS